MKMLTGLKNGVFFAIIVLCVLSESPVCAGVATRLQTLAVLHEGHSRLQDHPLAAAFSSKTLEKRQILRFLKDRIYLLEFLESRVFNTSTLKVHLPSGREYLFRRSEAYKRAYQQISGRLRLLFPSVAVTDYINYIRNLPEDLVALHVWFYLAGDTFGAQAFALSLNASLDGRYPSLGDSLKDFRGEKIILVRSAYHKWLEGVTGCSSKESHHNRESKVDRLKYEFTRAYEAYEQMFDEAFSAHDWSLYFNF